MLLTFYPRGSIIIIPKADNILFVRFILAVFLVVFFWVFLLLSVLAGFFLRISWVLDVVVTCDFCVGDFMILVTRVS